MIQIIEEVTRDKGKLMDLEENIRAFALLNAAKYNGKANSKAVLGQIFRIYPQAHDNPAEIKQLTEKIVEEINALSLDEIKAEIANLPPEFSPEPKKHEEKKELPPLPHSDKPIVMRMAPYPSGPLHIGNSRMVILNDTYVKRYEGRLLLVFDDTIGSEEKVVVSDAYDMIVEGLDWLGVKYDQKLFKSDRIPISYVYCRKALEQDIAYVCTCPAEEFKTLKLQQAACPHRDQPVETNLDEWEKMLAGAYEEHQAVVRLKIGMDNKNPAVRDPVIMRISNHEHPRVGTKYLVWPLLEFSWAIDDYLLGITHILRGKDLVKEDYLEEWVWNQFGWPKIDFIHYGLIKFAGLKLSKTQSRMNIESGNYIGWDDPRTWSLQSLMKRGIKPETLIEAMLSLGLSLVDIEYSPSALYAINRHLIDPLAFRYFFVPESVKVSIKNIPYTELEAHPLLHPEYPDKGTRTIPLSISNGAADIFISHTDSEHLEVGALIRLKDLFNIKIVKKGAVLKAEFHSKTVEDARALKMPIVQWVPAENYVPIRMLMPDGTTTEGFGEPACKELELDQIIQFERIGFGKINQITHNMLIYFAHP